VLISKGSVVESLGATLGIKGFVGVKNGCITLHF
jgi:hypothetical protein